MLELGSSGSVRGVLSNEHPYRHPPPEGEVPVSPIQTLSNSASLPPYLLHRLVLPEADENGVAKQPRSPREARLHRRPRRNSRRLESQLRPCADMVNRHIGALLAG